MTSDKLRINVYPADTGACGRYRLIHAALILRSQGHDIHIMDPNKPMGISVQVNDDDEVIDVTSPEADILVMQRIASRPHVQAMKILRERGYTVVLDLDDDMSRIHPDNGAFTSLHPSKKERMSWHYTSQAADAATLVTVSTEALVKVYGRHGRAMVLDNWIPEKYLELSHQDSTRYGWPGSVESHPDDLLVCGNAAELLAREGHMFHQVGPYQDKVDLQLRLEKHIATGPLALKHFASGVSTLGVAWAPLTDTLFNASKSRLKILEANSVGVPYVASPRAEYARMTAQGGAGLLANKPKDWYRKTKQLLNDDALRLELSQQGRQFAATQTIEIHAEKVLQAWHYAYDIQHGKLRKVSTIDLADRREGRLVASVKDHGGNT